MFNYRVIQFDIVCRVYNTICVNMYNYFNILFYVILFLYCSHLKLYNKKNNIFTDQLITIYLKYYHVFYSVTLIFIGCSDNIFFNLNLVLCPT